jgi:hypothetical protein
MEPSTKTGSNIDHLKKKLEIISSVMQIKDHEQCVVTTRCDKLTSFFEPNCNIKKEASLLHPL